MAIPSDEDLERIEQGVFDGIVECSECDTPMEPDCPSCPECGKMNIMFEYGLI